MGIRSGQEYREGLNTPREVWLNGERVEDVRSHPYLKNTVETMARLYDKQHDPSYKDIMTYPSPTTGDPVGTSFMVPRTKEDLVKRRKMIKVWADETYGLLGRSPDFLNTTLMAFYEARDFFDSINPKFADNVLKYYEYVREHDLFLTHALIDPQVDRSRSASQQDDPFTVLRVVRETDEGLIVRGAKMLATLAPLADEVLVYPLGGLKAGEEPYALVFAIPVSTPGLRLICREPIDLNRSKFDHPLESRFDEMDAVCVFHDVLVPWERVFLYGNVDAANAMYGATNLRNHTGHQTAIRALAKAEFATGIALDIAETIGIKQFLHVQEKLGELIAYLQFIEGAIILSEEKYETTKWGTVRCAFDPLQAMRTQFHKMYSRMLEVIKILGAGGLLATPTEKDLHSMIADDIAKYYKGANVPADRRIQLFKLAWDLVGSAFGQRSEQYERYYAGDPIRITATHYLVYNKEPLIAKAESLITGPR